MLNLSNIKNERLKIIPFTKIRVARKTSVSTTHCRLNEFDTANRTFWVWYYLNSTVASSLIVPNKAKASQLVKRTQPAEAWRLIRSGSGEP